MEGQTNTIFVRNLAVQANEQNLRDLFSRLDRVLNVQIMTFPGTSLRYARVDFGTSNGVTAAHSLNGQPFHGVPLTVSVTDPVDANASATAVAPLPNLGVPAAQQLAASVTSIRPQPGVGVTTIGGGVRDSGEEMILKRTVYVSGLANQVTLEEVRGMFGHFGEIKESSIDVSPYDQCQFALVEFQNEAAAQEAIRVGEIPYRGRVVRVEKSKETVKLYPPTDVVFGKPMTIGRHVTPLLPGNPGSQISGAMRTRRDELIDLVGEAAMQIEDWLESRG
ncbi:RNA-binding protein, putative [Perkinsus marinus ATCC 50983]|uniref:RNA-binding protein, putative n=1 Tax=Perkinsus marinus (strain ATCC 50983 / TXsc) TaxID=423536 RepID=C5LAI9_PERM5|nr:RNA-binding protein, putative [Perkinsus marinus ATCC 50983]EER06445.1 RNA-binding protein, putative [Perkinsus marinus ATCC 50983]|eukprot:XP_002774629.1 RNA-binding protein, putative [Perkinsus marinus ATCC 50983]